jgi:peptidoglycan hydrolase-like protein with peptidoglycan-binding domain
VAGTNGLSYVANANARNSHPTYHIARSGAVTGIVNPERRPFSTGGTPDPNAVTFEIDNSSTGGDWPITSESLEALIDVIVFHGSQSPRAGKGFALNQKGVTQSEFFIAWHKQYSATACPGPYIMSQLDYIVSECNRRASGVSTPTPSRPTPAPAPIPTPSEVFGSSKPPLSGWLKIGSTGNSVRYLQSVLGIRADGQFGPVTDKAVKAFQRANGLKADGIVGPLTWAKLGNSAPAPAPAPAPTPAPNRKPPLSGWLRIGSSGASVRYLQSVLGIKADGIFGPVTDRAVKAFQSQHRLKADGIVGPLTWAKLP